MTDRITDEMVEAAARAMAATFSPKPWECACTSRKGLDCDCGDAMLEDRCDRYDDNISRRDCYQGAIAALSAALPLMDGWQPIETAPKDGTRIVLIDGLKGVKAVGSWTQYGFGEKKKFGWYPFENPRFWLPLPPAPKGE